LPGRVSSELEGTVHQAANIQFERIVAEYARWRAIPEEDRSPAPGWWWGPAFEARGLHDPLPVAWCTQLGLSDGGSYADGAAIFLKSFAGQTSLPWPGQFPGNERRADTA
jgi:hypothetical protein